jgi:hypothetical protein
MGSTTGTGANYDNRMCAGSPLLHGPVELHQYQSRSSPRKRIQGQEKKDLDSRVRGNERNML